jgi:acetyltransferase
VSPRHRPAPRWPVTAYTDNRLEYHIRPITPADRERERDFIARMSPESRYLRFMHPLREVSEKQLDEFVTVDGRRTMALIATVGAGDEERIIGVARYAADQGGDECEFAVAVADDWQGLGVGTTLIPLLFEHAARAGFSVIYGNVLVGNQRMVELANWCGLTVEAPSHGCETVRAWKRLN